MRPLPSLSLKPVSRAVLGLALALVLAGLSACAGYRVGPVNDLPMGHYSVKIHPFLNQTLQPRLTDAVALELRKEFQRDGTYRLATHDEADLEVTGTILRYERLEVNFSPTDVLTVRDYRLQMVALVNVTDPNTGKEVVKNRTIRGTTLIRVGSDLSSSERQGLPLLAEDLARQLKTLLAEGAW
jgi:hypothetical protein